MPADFKSAVFTSFTIPAGSLFVFAAAARFAKATRRGDKFVVAQAAQLDGLLTDARLRGENLQGFGRQFGRQFDGGIIFVEVDLTNVARADAGFVGDGADDVFGADAVVVGPGLSQSETARECLRRILLAAKQKPLLIDADGLNLLAGDGELRNLLTDHGGRCVLTPHIGELSRLTGKSIAELKCGTWEAALALAQTLNCVVAAKDARTFVCAKDRAVCMNRYGNDGMATAGSGDVLAGIIGGLMAQAGEKKELFDTVCAGVYVHAAAGELVGEELGTYGCMASDLADAAARVLKKSAVAETAEQER